MNLERIGEDSESRVVFFGAPTAPTECRNRVTHAGERHRDCPGIGGQLLGDGTQTNSNPYADVRARLTWSPDAVLTQ